MSRDSMNARSSSSKRVAEDPLARSGRRAGGCRTGPGAAGFPRGRGRSLRDDAPDGSPRPPQRAASRPRSSRSSRPTSSSSRRLSAPTGSWRCSTVAVDDAYLEAAGPQLRIVANYAVGVNNIDLEAARRRGVVISNTPDVLTGATAEVALTLMLSLLRRVTEGDRFVRRREPWQFSLEFMLGERLAGKTVLIVGAGRIGRETARLVEAFGADARPRRPRRRPRRAPARRPTSSRCTCP